MKRLSLLTLLVGACALLASQADAAYPEHPITLIVAYGAGGSTDVTARKLAPFIAKYLGGTATVEVVNKTGGGGEVGFSAAADATADGYGIGFINLPNFITIPIERQARYSLDQFDPLVNLVLDPGVFVVHADSEHKTLADLVTFAQANPRKVIIGTTGVGSDDHLAMLMMQRQAKVVFTHAPFNSDSDATQALLARKIVVEAMNLSEAQRLKATSPVRILGVMSDKRDATAADVPTFKEQGYDVIGSAARGIAVPKGVPDDVRARLVDAIIKAANDPDFRKEAEALFLPMNVLPPESYAEMISASDKQFRVLWKESPWNK